MGGMRMKMTNRPLNNRILKMHLQGMLILLRPVFLSQDFTCLDPKLPKTSWKIIPMKNWLDIQN